MQQGCHRGLGQASAPFGLTRDDPDDLAVVVERNCDEIGAVATIDFPDSLRVVTERPEIFLDVIMFAEQEDRHLPEVAPNKFILVGFGDEPSHSLTEESAERFCRQTGWIGNVKIGRASCRARVCQYV